MDPYKILVLGYDKTGKTTMLVNLNGQPTETIDEYTVVFDTDGYGQIQFVCAESSDNEIKNTWNVNGFIVMFDLTKPYSYDVMKQICNHLKGVSASRPIVLVGNKKDSRKRVVNEITADKEFNLQLYEISASKKDDIEKPFLYLARSLMKLPTLAFVPEVIPGPVEDPIHVHVEDNIAPTHTIRSPTNNMIDLGKASSSAAAGVLQSSPVKSARRHRETLRINGNEEVLQVMNNQRPTCCYLN